MDGMQRKDNRRAVPGTGTHSVGHSISQCLKTTLLTILALSWPVLIMAQITTGTISLPYHPQVQVLINGQPLQDYPSLSVDEGRLVLSGLELGRYTVIMDRSGFIQEQVTVSLTSLSPEAVLEFPRFTPMIGQLNLYGASVPVHVRLLTRPRKELYYTIAPHQRLSLTLPFDGYFVEAVAPGFMVYRDTVRLVSPDIRESRVHLERPDPGTALKKSLLWPGSGQTYSGQLWKGRVLMITTMALCAWAGFENLRLVEYEGNLERGIEAFDHLPSFEEIYAQSSYVRYYDTAVDRTKAHIRTTLALAAGVYLFNLVDILFLMPK